MNATDLVELGSTGLVATELGIGTNPLGGLYASISPDQAISTIERSWDLGIRFFDTAPVYGFGNAERILGEALSGKPRDEYLLATKVGRLLLDEGPPESEDTSANWQGSPLYRGTDSVRPFFDFSYDGVMRSIEASQERTGMERFDIVHLHDPDLYQDLEPDGALRALEELRLEGIISAIGCGTNQWEMLAEFAQSSSFDCFLLAGRYTLLDQSALPTLLPLCSERDIVVIGAGVYNSGLLAHRDPRELRGADDSPDPTVWVDNLTFDYRPARQEVIDRASAIAQVCENHRVPLRAASIQFPLHHPVIPTVLVGPRTEEHVVDNIEMLRFKIPSDLWTELKVEGLIARSAPIKGES